MILCLTTNLVGITLAGIGLLSPRRRRGYRWTRWVGNMGLLLGIKKLISLAWSAP